jgi:hypothetical protein
MVDEYTVGGSEARCLLGLGHGERSGGRSSRFATVLLRWMERLIRASDAESSSDSDGDSCGVLGLLFLSFTLDSDGMEERATESGRCLRRRGDGEAEGVAELMYM